jgi:hypothetical protein
MLCIRVERFLGTDVQRNSLPFSNPQRLSIVFVNKSVHLYVYLFFIYFHAMTSVIFQQNLAQW